MKKNILIAVLGIMLMLSFTFGMVQKAAADEARQLAEMSRIEAEKQAALAEENAMKAHQAMALAEEQRRLAEEMLKQLQNEH